MRIISHVVSAQLKQNIFYKAETLNRCAVHLYELKKHCYSIKKLKLNCAFTRRRFVHPYIVWLFYSCITAMIQKVLSLKGSRMG